LEKEANGHQWKLAIKFEYTGRSTPQRNHLAELGLAVLTKHGVALMVRAHVPMKIRYRVFREAFKTATVLNGLEAVSIDEKVLTRYNHCVGKIPSFAKHLRTWGEAGTVKIKTATTAKLADKVVQCMFIGYATNSGGDVYQMWNPITNRVHNTRNVIWLKRMYFKPQDDANEDEVVVDDMIVEQEQITGQVNGTETVASDESFDSEKRSISEERSIESEERSIESEEESPTPITTTRSGRTVQPPSRLIEEMAGIQITNQVAGIGADIGGGFENTNELRVMTYQEAMNTQDRDKWIKAVEEDAIIALNKTLTTIEDTVGSRAQIYSIICL